ncbi:MAG: phosphatase PAP2 family protein, partial [Bacteroidales bacterium]|nr:phosphatase PAP2 family protein [Bacteroidales bacterium]
VFAGLTLKNKWIWTGLLFWAILVSYSRIYLGVHYPADILGGMILGGFWAIILFLSTKKLLKINNKTIS